MRRISLLLVSLIVLTIQAALAQSFSVKGTVVSAGDNEPLIGVTILQEGTTMVLLPILTVTLPSK